MYIGNSKSSNGVINPGVHTVDEIYAWMRRYPRNWDDLTLNNTVDLIASIGNVDTTESTLTFDGGAELSGTSKWFGGVLAPNGKIYGIPGSSTSILEISGIGNMSSAKNALTHPFVTKL